MKFGKSLPIGISRPRSECPYGCKPFLGLLLTPVCILKAGFPILERLATQGKLFHGSLLPINLTSCLLWGSFFLLTLSALLASDSPAVKLGMGFCALAGLSGTVLSAATLFFSDLLYTETILSLLSYMLLTAGFFVFSICRDHVRDASRLSLAAVLLLIPRTVLTGLSYWVAWRILSGTTGAVVTLLTVCSRAVFFIDIVLWMLAAVVFFFMRTEVPNARYPDRISYEDV